MMEQEQINNNNNKSKLVWVIVAIVIIGAAYLIFERLGQKTINQTEEKKNVVSTSSEVLEWETKPSTVLGKENYGGIETRAYDIELSADGLKPKELVVRDGVNIILTLRSKDGNYNLYFPDFNKTLEAKKGEISSESLMFFTEKGKEYSFYCKKCPNDKKVEGKVIVKGI